MKQQKKRPRRERVIDKYYSRFGEPIDMRGYGYRRGGLSDNAVPDDSRERYFGMR